MKISIGYTLTPTYHRG